MRRIARHSASGSRSGAVASSRSNPRRRRMNSGSMLTRLASARSGAAIGPSRGNTTSISACGHASRSAATDSMKHRSEP